MGWIYKGPHNRPKTKNELKAQGLDYSYFQQRRPTATANKSRKRWLERWSGQQEGATWEEYQERWWLWPLEHLQRQLPIFLTPLQSIMLIPLSILFDLDPLGYPLSLLAITCPRNLCSFGCLFFSGFLFSVCLMLDFLVKIGYLTVNEGKVWFFRVLLLFLTGWMIQWCGDSRGFLFLIQIWLDGHLQLKTFVSRIHCCLIFSVLVFFFLTDFCVKLSIVFVGFGVFFVSFSFFNLSYVYENQLQFSVLLLVQTLAAAETISLESTKIGQAMFYSIFSCGCDINPCF